MVVHMAVYDSLLITDEVDISDDHDVLTMKIAPHSDVWEFYIACEFQRRIRNLREPATLNVHQSRVAAAHSVTVFKDASVTLLKYLPHQDSLLDVLLAYQCENKFMDESLVIFYAIELLGILEDLRDCNIFHGAVCPENLLLRSGKAPTGKWFKDGSNGWRDHGLVIINFEKSSDLQLGSSATSLEKCEKALAEPQLQNV
jgi:serine/threonine protein kinase